MVGDIVWAPFPFTDLTQAKLRPVLILADVKDGMELDWIVCEITTSLGHAREIPITRGDMEAGGLRIDSQVRPDRLATLNESIFRRTAGRVSAAKLAEIAAAARSLF